MGNINHFLDALREDSALRDPLVHHESLPACDPIWADTLPSGFEFAAPLLEHRGIAGLYSHQSRALQYLAAGENVVLSTPTASGKTLVYNLPVIRSALEDPESRALYLFPLKALERDQRQRLENDIAALGLHGEALRVAIYDGDTSQSERRRLRADPPQVLITTPDMLHAGILPHHGVWQRFFAGLDLVVLDELHTYRGIFGSHVAQVLRRLNRVARFHGAEPQWVAASATISNPGELATALTSRPFRVVQENGAPQPDRRVLLFRPTGSPYTLAARLFRLAIHSGLRTIAFTKARVITELMYTWITESDPALAERISAYRAGFLPEERREIEQRLFSGDLLGVLSTSALELGIDVGGLDFCLLVGYPGSQVSTWQRGGRVGRSREAAIALVAQPDALDQYLVSHPHVFFERAFENAVVDPHNEEIASAHLPCAAAEVPLRADESWMAEPGARANLERLERDVTLLRSEGGEEWFAARRTPHRDVSLRQIGTSYTITVDGDRSKRPHIVGSIGAARVFAECHEGAIYLHRGRQFVVEELDCDTRTVWVRAVNVPYYTRALSEKKTEILSRDRTRPMGNARLTQGRLKVTTTLSRFERRRVRGQDLLSTEPLDLPPTSFETVGIWLEFPDEIPHLLESEDRHTMGGIHATEHAALALFPLFALCDRHDVAGISYVRHPETERASVFFYDGQPGGVGLAASLFDRLEALLEATLEVVSGCDCEQGCPACVHSPKCGSGNRPIDKAASIRLLGLALGHEPLTPIERTGDSAHASSAETNTAKAPLNTEPTPRVVYFDIETQRSANDVGGWHNAHLMRVAVAVTFDTVTKAFQTYRESDVPDLIEHLAAADLVVGFNIRSFDYKVLRGYTQRNLSELPTFDMLEEIHQRLGFRLALGHLAEETLGVPKSADGLQSLEWWKQGRIDEIVEYCQRDVELMRDLLTHAQTHGNLFFRTRNGERVRLPAAWSLDEIVEKARSRRITPPSRARRSPPSSTTRTPPL
ncbi:DEAD/DEAH box helicase [Myxococcota bacterium]|nr:DEAD/DEAH box helicase [Myxococcota bacterium]